MAIAIPQYATLVRRSREGTTKGNLGQLRSALNIYYADNEHEYPWDDLSCLPIGSKYIDRIPPVLTPTSHDQRFGVISEATPTDTGFWSYNNVVGDLEWGRVRIGCLHTTLAGEVWTSF